MRHARMATLIACLGALLAVLAACANPVQRTPITSAGDPAAPVPFRWTLQAEGGGGTLRLQGGTLHAIADEVRLLDAAGKTVASATATPLGAGDSGLCG